MLDIKTNVLLNILIGVLCSSCYAQKNRIENEIMKCTYQSYSDNGRELQKLILDYQNHLIEEKILEDNSGQSYKTFLYNFAKGKGHTKTPSLFFSMEFDKIDKPDKNKFQECKKKIIGNYLYQDIFKLKSVDETFINGDRPHHIANEIMKNLSKNDFTIDYYKMRIFLLFSIIDTGSGIKKQ